MPFHIVDLELLLRVIAAGNVLGIQSFAFRTFHQEPLMTSESRQSRKFRRTGRRTPAGRACKRGYDAADVVKLRGSVKIEHTLAKLGAEKLWKKCSEMPFVNSLGALTGNQAMQQVKAGVPAIYLSGWQVAADANDSLSMYPDQSLYATTSVPTVVRRINNALMRAGPDPDHGRQGRHRLVRADRRRRRVGLRRRAERLRADEGDDRRRRRRRALRGPARLA